MKKLFLSIAVISAMTFVSCKKEPLTEVKQKPVFADTFRELPTEGGPGFSTDTNAVLVEIILEGTDRVDPEMFKSLATYTLRTKDIEHFAFQFTQEQKKFIYLMHDPMEGFSVMLEEIGEGRIGLQGDYSIVLKINGFERDRIDKNSERNIKGGGFLYIYKCPVEILPPRQK